MNKIPLAIELELLREEIMEHPIKAGIRGCLDEFREEFDLRYARISLIGGNKQSSFRFTSGENPKNDQGKSRIETISGNRLSTSHALRLDFLPKKRFLSNHRLPTLEDLAQFETLYLELEIQRQAEFLTFRESIFPFLDPDYQSAQCGESPLQAPLQTLIEYLECSIATLWQFQDQIVNQPPLLLLRATAGKHDHSEYKYTCLREGTGLVWTAFEETADPIVYKKIEDGSCIVNKDIVNDYVGKSLAFIKLESESKLLAVVCLVDIEKEKLEQKINYLQYFQKATLLIIKQATSNRRRTVLEELPKTLPQGTFTLQDLAAFVVNSVGDLIGSSAVSIFLENGKMQEPKILELIRSFVEPTKSKSNLLKRFEERWEVPEYDINKKSLTTEVFKKNLPTLSMAVSKDERNSKSFREINDKDYDSFIAVPIRDSLGSPIGVLRALGKIYNLDGRLIPSVFDMFDLFVLEYLSQLFTKLFETLQSIEKHKKITEHLSLSEKIRTHEVSAPLSNITLNASFVDRYMNDQSATTKSGKLNEIIADADICAFLLREASIPERSKFKENLHLLSLHELLEEVEGFLVRQIRARSRVRFERENKGVPFDKTFEKFMHVNLYGSKPTILAHKWLLHRAFYNLGINAIKYGKKGGHLIIRIKESVDGRFVDIEFTDDGPGVPKGEEEMIFEKLTRGSNVEDYPGEGLGLSLAREIFEAHGGRLSLHSPRNPTSFVGRLKLDAALSNDDATMTHHNIIYKDEPIL